MHFAAVDEKGLPLVQQITFFPAEHFDIAALHV